MNEKKTVYNALFSGQEAKKVELAIVDDIKKLTSSLKKDTDKADGAFDKASNKIENALKETKQKVAAAIDAFSDSLEIMENSAKPLFGALGKFESAAKEIGLKPSENDAYNAGEDAIADYDFTKDFYGKKIKDLNALYKSLKTKI